jgi:hypothetical protein
VLLTDYQAWWVVPGSWKEMHLADAAFNARVRSSDSNQNDEGAADEPLAVVVDLDQRLLAVGAVLHPTLIASHWRQLQPSRVAPWRGKRSASVYADPGGLIRGGAIRCAHPYLSTDMAVRRTPNHRAFQHKGDDHQYNGRSRGGVPEGPDKGKRGLRSEAFTNMWLGDGGMLQTVSGW